MKQLLFILFLTVLCTSFINAQGKIAVGVQGGVAIPMGDFGDGYDMGFGGTGTFAYHVNPMLDVTGSVGYLTWNGKVDGISLSSIPILAGVRYYFGQGKFHPYVAGELGIHFTSSKVEFFGVSVSGSSSDFGFGAGAGFLYQLGPKLDLDVNAKFSSIATSGSSSSFINIMAGVLVAL